MEPDITDPTATPIARISNINGDQTLDRFGVPDLDDHDDSDYQDAREDLRDAIRWADRIRSTAWVDSDRGVTAEVALVPHAGAWWTMWADEASWSADAWADRDAAEADYDRMARFAASGECFGPADRSDIDDLVLPDGMKRDRDPETGDLIVVPR